jgi:voltage-gated potassium channel Kch
VPEDPIAERATRPPPSRLDARVRRVVATRRIFPVLVLITLSLALLAGFVATLVDKEDFPSLEIGVWWAIVTLATVGYGDVVPTTTWGRVVGSATIIVGVTFLSFLTAIVTSLFISTEQEQKAAEEAKVRAASEAETRALIAASEAETRALIAASEAETRALFLRLDERLAAIDARLDRSP